jgi:hypothetical protein
MMTSEALNSEGLKHTFNVDNQLSAAVAGEITIRKAFYFLVNVEEHPEVLPLAYDTVVKEFQGGGGELGMQLPQSSGNSSISERIDALVTLIAGVGMEFIAPWRLSKSDLTRRWVMHFYNQYMPMALVDGCWLQAGARVATAHTKIGATITGLYQHQVRAFVADPGRHFVGDYRAAYVRLGGPIDEVSTHSFSERPDTADQSFDLPLFLLALAQFTRTFSAEIVGVNLAWQFLGLPSFGPRLIGDICEVYDLPSLGKDLVEPRHLEKGLDMARSAAVLVMEEAAPEDRDKTWSRLVSGGAAFIRLWREWFEATRSAAPSGPPDPRQEMIDLVWRKAPHAQGYHGNRPLGVKLIDDHLNPDTFDGPALLEALANSPWVRPGESHKSPLLNRLIGFGGPMFGVFSPGEQQIIRDWIDSLPPREGRNRAEGDRTADLGITSPDMKPTIRDEKTIEGRLWGPSEFRLRSNALFGKWSVRELYHHLVNVEFYPEILPVAEHFARDRLERSMAMMWKGERPIPSRHYDVAALERWVAQKHREQVDSYRPPSARPEVPKDAFIEATV